MDRNGILSQVNEIFVETLDNEEVRITGSSR